MKLVVEVRSPYSDAQVIEIARTIMREGSFSHPAYAELQGRDSRLVVEIAGVVTAEDSPGDQALMAVIPLGT